MDALPPANQDPQKRKGLKVLALRQGNNQKLRLEDGPQF